MAATGTLIDDFSAGTIDTTRWPTSGGGTLVNGRVRVVSNADWPTLASAQTYNLTGSAVFAEFLPAAQGDSTAADNYSKFMVESATAGTELTFEHKTATGEIVLGDYVGWWEDARLVISYDPVAMRWLRFREDAGTTYWETSPDGVTWTVRRSKVTPAWVADGTSRVMFQTYRSAGTMTSEYMEIDNVNVAPTAPVSEPEQPVPTSYRRGTVFAGGEYGDNGSAYGDPGAAGGMTYTNPGVYGDDYLYPAAADFSYLASRMVDPIGKLMVRMERLTSSPGGELRPIEITRITEVLDGAAAAGVGIIINPWNFGAIWTDNGSGTSVRHPLGDSVFTQSVFNDFWVKVVTQWGTHPALIGVELMTEPVDLPGGAAAWETACQSALNAIRTVSSDLFVWVPNYGWAINEINLHASGPWITDATGNFGYTGHQYNYNRGGSQTDYANALQSAIDQGYTAGTEVDALHAREVESARAWATWLGNHKGFMSEYGYPQAEHAATTEAPKWHAFAERMLSEYDEQGWWGTIWTSGRVLTASTLYTVYYPSGGYNTAVDSGTSLAAVVEAHQSSSAPVAVDAMNVWLGGIETPATWSMWKLGQEVAIYWATQDPAPDAPPEVHPVRLRSASTSTVVSTTTNKTVLKPGVLNEGDLMIFVLTSYGTSAANCALPAGFTQIASHARTTSHTLKIGWKLATASEPATYTPTIPSGNSHRADILAFYDADSTKLGTPIIGTTAASSTAHAAPSVTPTTDNGRLLSLVSGGGGNAWTHPSGMLERTDSQTAASHYLTLATADQAITSSAATGTRTWGGGGGNYSQITASLFIPSVVKQKVTPVALVGTDPTAGTTGSKTDARALTFQATQGAAVTSEYHRWASHLVGDGPYPLVIHLHGDGGYEYDNPDVWTSPQYMDVAKSINAIGIIPNTPDKTSGFRRWWEGYEPTYWLVDLIAELKRTYNIDENRIFISGFSGGAVVTTSNLVADWPEIFGGGGAMMLGGGGPYTTGAPIPAGLQDRFLMRWHVGDSDEGLNDDGTIADDGYDAITDAQNGEAKYRADGWNTAIELIPGGTDHLESEPMGPARLQKLINEFNARHGF